MSLAVDGLSMVETEQHPFPTFGNEMIHTSPESQPLLKVQQLPEVQPLPEVVSASLDFHPNQAYSVAPIISSSMGTSLGTTTNSDLILQAARLIDSPNPAELGISPMPLLPLLSDDTKVVDVKFPHELADLSHHFEARARVRIHSSSLGISTSDGGQDVRKAFEYISARLETQVKSSMFGLLAPYTANKTVSAQTLQKHYVVIL